MKINKIKNAYIKNLPMYNYQIFDQDKVLVAKGHLLSNKDKQYIMRMIVTNIDDAGNAIQDIPDYNKYISAWIIKSID